MPELRSLVRNATIVNTRRKVNLNSHTHVDDRRFHIHEYPRIVRSGFFLCFTSNKYENSTRLFNPSHAVISHTLIAFNYDRGPAKLPSFFLQLLIILGYFNAISS